MFKWDIVVCDLPFGKLSLLWKIIIVWGSINCKAPFSIANCQTKQRVASSIWENHGIVMIAPVVLKPNNISLQDNMG